MMLLLEDKLSEIKDELYIHGNFGCLYEEDIEERLEEILNDIRR